MSVCTKIGTSRGWPELFTQRGGLTKKEKKKKSAARLGRLIVWYCTIASASSPLVSNPTISSFRPFCAHPSSLLPTYNLRPATEWATWQIRYAASAMYDAFDSFRCGTNTVKIKYSAFLTLDAAICVTVWAVRGTLRLCIVSINHWIQFQQVARVASPGFISWSILQWILTQMRSLPIWLPNCVSP